MTRNLIWTLLALVGCGGAPFVAGVDPGDDGGPGMADSGPSADRLRPAPPPPVGVTRDAGSGALETTQEAQSGNPSPVPEAGPVPSVDAGTPAPTPGSCGPTTATVCGGGMSAYACTGSYDPTAFDSSLTCGAGSASGSMTLYCCTTGNAAPTLVPEASTTPMGTACLFCWQDGGACSCFPGACQAVNPSTGLPWGGGANSACIDERNSSGTAGTRGTCKTCSACDSTCSPNF